MKLNSVLSCAAFALASLLPALSSADSTYPSQPIRVIVPYAPGGASDVLARLLVSAPDAPKDMIVENRAGGATVAGTSVVAQAKPNGYTLGLIDSTFTINPALLGDKLPYNTKTDFVPVILLAATPIIIAVNKNVPVQDLKQLIALAKAKPGALNFSSAGNGTALHLAGEEFNLAAGTNIVHVPYKGGGPSVMAVVAGETQIVFSAPSTILQHVKSGRLRALAVSGKHRLALMPDVPTFTELGLGKVDALTTFGIIAPKGLPEPIATQLAATFNRVLAEGPIRKRVDDLGFEVAGGSPADFKRFIADDIARWQSVVTAAHVHVDN